VLHFVVPRPDRWIFGWMSIIIRGKVFCFAGFSRVVGFEDIK
jgi:hypothetical protein